MRRDEARRAVGFIITSYRWNGEKRTFWEGDVNGFAVQSPAIRWRCLHRQETTFGIYPPSPESAARPARSSVTETLVIAPLRLALPLVERSRHEATRSALLLPRSHPVRGSADRHRHDRRQRQEDGARSGRCYSQGRQRTHPNQQPRRHAGATRRLLRPARDG